MGHGTFGLRTREHPCRHRHGTTVHQIDEVREDPQARVQAQGCLQHVLHGGVTSDGGQQQGIDTRPHGLRLALELLERILALKGLRRAGRGAGQDQLSGERQHGLGLGPHEALQGCVALGDPRPLIEQTRGLQKSRHIDLDQLAAQRAGVGDGVVEGLPIDPIIQVGELMAQGHTQTGVGRPVRRGHREGARIGVTGIKGLGHLKDPLGVVCAKGKDRDRVQRAASGHHAAGAQQATTGLEADQLVECRWHPPRAGRVGPQRKADLAQGDGDRRP